MPGPGRNQPCPCGSGHKTKRCCGQQRGPAAEQLARAHVATLCPPDDRRPGRPLRSRARHPLGEPHRPAQPSTLPAGHAAHPDRPRPTTPARIRPRRRSRLGLGRTHRRRPTDRHPTTTRPTRRRDHRTPRPTPHRPPPRRLRAPGPQHPIHPPDRRQPARSRRRLSRRAPHPRRPPNRRLTPVVYPGEVVSRASTRIRSEPKHGTRDRSEVLPPPVRGVPRRRRVGRPASVSGGRRLLVLVQKPQRAPFRWPVETGAAGENAPVRISASCSMRGAAVSPRARRRPAGRSSSAVPALRRCRRGPRRGCR